MVLLGVFSVGALLFAGYRAFFESDYQELLDLLRNGKVYPAKIVHTFTQYSYYRQDRPPVPTEHYELTFIVRGKQYSFSIIGDPPATHEVTALPSDPRVAWPGRVTSADLDASAALARQGESFIAGITVLVILLLCGFCIFETLFRRHAATAEGVVSWTGGSKRTRLCTYRFVDSKGQNVVRTCELPRDIKDLDVGNRVLILFLPSFPNKSRIERKLMRGETLQAEPR